MVLKLKEFAYFPNWPEHLGHLAEMALPEPWRFKRPLNDFLFADLSILDFYLKAVFRALAIERSQHNITMEAANMLIYLSQERACFHTGLLTKHYKPIYAYFVRNKREGAIQDWYFRGFFDDTASFLLQIEPLPAKPFQGLNASKASYYINWPIRVNVSHILENQRNLERIPEHIRYWGNLSLLLEAGVELARRQVSITPSAVVPQLYQGQVQFLLPISLMVPDSTDLAMTLVEMDGYYLASTCLDLEMSYHNARMLAKPTAPWLINLVV